MRVSCFLLAKEPRDTIKGKLPTQSLSSLFWWWYFLRKREDNVLEAFGLFLPSVPRSYWQREEHRVQREAGFIPLTMVVASLTDIVQSYSLSQGLQEDLSH